VDHVVSKGQVQNFVGGVEAHGRLGAKGVNVGAVAAKLNSQIINGHSRGKMEIAFHFVDVKRATDITPGALHKQFVEALFNFFDVWSRKLVLIIDLHDVLAAVAAFIWMLFLYVSVNQTTRFVHSMMMCRADVTTAAEFGRSWVILGFQRHHFSLVAPLWHIVIIALEDRIAMDIDRRPVQIRLHVVHVPACGVYDVQPNVLTLHGMERDVEIDRDFVRNAYIHGKMIMVCFRADGVVVELGDDQQDDEGDGHQRNCSANLSLFLDL
jgi:hypothetical protein